MDGSQDFTPVAAGAYGKQRGKDEWSAPGSGTPIQPGDAASPSASEIAAQVAQKLVVPRGPMRTVCANIGIVPPITNLISPGSTVPAGALNSKIIQPILAAPGLIRAIDFQSQIVTTGAASGVFQLFDGDTNSPLLRTFIINVGAAGTFFESGYAEATTALPFLQGILAVWTPIVAAFGSSIICCNIDFESIPIGQKMGQS